MDGWDIMVRMIFPFSRPFSQLDFSMHSGRPLAHFGHPWASKRLTFGSPWLTFSTFWIPFGSLWFPVPHFWHPFQGDWILDYKLNTFSWICTIGKRFLRMFMVFVTHLRRKYPATWPSHPPTAFRSSFHPCPERNLAVGNFDPLRALRRPGRVRVRRAFSIFCFFLLLVHLLSLIL